MPFWTVGDAGPYKEKPNFFMGSPLLGVLFLLPRRHLIRPRSMPQRGFDASSVSPLEDRQARLLGAERGNFRASREYLVTSTIEKETVFDRLFSMIERRA